MSVNDQRGYNYRELTTERIIHAENWHGENKLNNVVDVSNHHLECEEPEFRNWKR